MAAEGPPPLMRDLSGPLARAILGAPGGNAGAGNAEDAAFLGGNNLGSAGPSGQRDSNFAQSQAQALGGALIGTRGAEPRDPRDDGNSQTEPLQRQTSTRNNRERFAENQREIAAQRLAHALPIFACVMLALLGLIVAGITIYVSGVITWFNHASEPCDQPLKWWLLTTLCVPCIQQCLGACESEERPRKLTVLIMPIAVGFGAWFYFNCKTCQKTNPALYGFVRLYLIYISVVWVTLLVSFFGMVTLVFWMARNGLLESGPGPAMAAKPGLILELETVEYSANLFSETDQPDGERQPPECCICTEAFSAGGGPIKKTPCGHYFHEECLGQWLANYARSCPLCRTDLEDAMDGQGGAAELGQVTPDGRAGPPPPSNALSPAAMATHHRIMGTQNTADDRGGPPPHSSAQTSGE